MEGCLHTVLIGLLLVVSVSSICQLPDVPKNGYYAPDKPSFSMSDKVQYHCHPNFALIGDSERTCEASGKWTGFMPFCDTPTKLAMPSWTSDKMVDGHKETCHPIIHGMTLTMAEPGIVQAVRIHVPKQAITKVAVFTIQNKTVKSCKDYSIKADTEEWVMLKCENTQGIADKIRVMHLGDGEDRIDICEIGAYVRTGEWCEYPPSISVRGGYFEVSRDRAILHCPGEQKSDVSSLICKNNTWIGSDVNCDKKEEAITVSIEKERDTTNKQFLESGKVEVHLENCGFLQSKVNILIAIVIILILSIVGFTLYEIWRRRGKSYNKPSWMRMASDDAHE